MQARLEDVLEDIWRRYWNTSCKHVLMKSWTSLEDVLEDEKLLHWRRLGKQEMFGGTLADNCIIKRRLSDVISQIFMVDRRWAMKNIFGFLIWYRFWITNTTSVVDVNWRSKWGINEAMFIVRIQCFQLSQKLALAM